MNLHHPTLSVLLLLCPGLGCGGDDGDAAATGATATAGGTATEDHGDANGSETATTSAGTGASGAGSSGSGSGGSNATGNGSSDGSGGSAGTSGSDTGSTGQCGNAPGQLLGPDQPWNQPVDSARTTADSAAVINYLQQNVTSGVRMQVDFSITVQEANASAPREAFNPTGDHFSPDCDTAPIPVPAGGHVEGNPGYTCDNDGDCHLIVVDREECRLYEQWRADFAGSGNFDGGCLAIWELDTDYDETLRGDYCTSADAAGLPIAPLVFTADEVAAGEIPHAIRFIVPNRDIRDDRYVRPATHSTPATSGPVEAPPYGARLRLRADADLSGLNAAARIVAEAMQTYGIILADAGNVTFTAASDDFSATTWDAVGFGPHDLKALQWSDFEVVDTGAPITWSAGDCSRTPITQ